VEGDPALAISIPWPEGAQTGDTVRLTAAATDVANLETIETRTFTFDGDAPAVRVVSPLGFSDGNAEIEVDVTDSGSGLAKVEFTLNGATTEVAVVDDRAKASYALSGTNHVLIVEATDGVGNRTETTLNITVNDTSAPVFFSLSPADDGFAGDSQEVTACFTDDSPLEQVVVIIDGQETELTETPEGTDTALRCRSGVVTLSEQGLVNGTLRAVDDAGNETSQGFTWTWDDTPPTVQTSFVHQPKAVGFPAVVAVDSVYYVPTAMPVVRVAISDDESGATNQAQVLQKAEGSVDFAVSPVEATPGTYDLTLDLSDAGEGPASLKLHIADNAGNPLVDAAGNPAPVELLIAVDTAPPSCTLEGAGNTEPKHTNQVQYPMTGLAQDGEFGVGGVTLRAERNSSVVEDLISSASADTGAYTLAVPVGTAAPGGTDGNWSVQAVCTDALGNGAESEVLSLLVDTVAPSLSFETSTLSNFTGDILVDVSGAVIYQPPSTTTLGLDNCINSQVTSVTYNCTTDNLTKQPLDFLLSGEDGAFHIMTGASDSHLVAPTAQFYADGVPVGEPTELSEEGASSAKYRATLPLEAIAITGLVPDSVTITASDTAGNSSSFTVLFDLKILAGVIEMTDEAGLGPAGPSAFGLDPEDTPLADVFEWTEAVNATSLANYDGLHVRRLRIDNPSPMAMGVNITTVNGGAELTESYQRARIETFSGATTPVCLTQGDCGETGCASYTYGVSSGIPPLCAVNETAFSSYELNFDAFAPNVVTAALFASADEYKEAINPAADALPHYVVPPFGSLWLVIRVDSQQLALSGSPFFIDDVAYPIYIPQAAYQMTRFSQTKCQTMLSQQPPFPQTTCSATIYAEPVTLQSAQLIGEDNTIDISTKLLKPNQSDTIEGSLESTYTVSVPFAAAWAYDTPDIQFYPLD
ncbi:MAG: hypothetical protein VX223_07730, partial [Myxococcota bacterium]|nr:hypothetical protein [Myxococcota bacterium]